MKSKKELLEANQKYAVFHFRCLIILIIYLIMETLGNFMIGTPAFFRALIVTLFFVLEQALRPVDFFKSTKLLFGMKYVLLCILSVFIVMKGNQFYEYIIYSFIIFTVILELSSFYDLLENSNQILFSLTMIAPMSVFGFLYISLTSDYLYVINMCIEIILSGFMFYGVAKFYGSRASLFEKTVLAKERMIEKAMDINNDNMARQEKLFYVNEQLGTKRIELEEANRKNKLINKEMRLQNDVLKFYSSTMDITQYADYMSEKLVSELNASCAGVIKIMDKDAVNIYEDLKKYNPKYDTYSRYRLFGNVSDDVKEIVFKEFGTREFIFDTLGNELLICSNIKRLGYSSLAEKEINSIALKAILIDGHKSLVYVIAHSDANFFDDKKPFVENLANQLQVAINNGYNYSQYENRAIHDGLTGLYNRTILNKTLEKYRHSDSIIKQEHIAAVMIDIDNFKKVNDTYGHVFGDHVLVALAGIIQDSIKEYHGIGFRYGGEEFVVLFINKELDEVVKSANVILENVRGTTITLDNVTINITVSIGISSYPDTSVEQNRVIDDADRALYVSKTTGKNRITVEPLISKEVK